MLTPCVAYYRVSTRGQEESGLGLKAQQRDVEAYVQRIGGEIIRSFTETESGTECDRPQLTAALAFAKRAQAILVVAKLDRLSRNLAFLAQLMEAHVNFVCCDNPSATELTTHIHAAMAQYEAKLISERTKKGLASIKAKAAELRRQAVVANFQGRPDEARRLREEAAALGLGSARPHHWEGMTKDGLHTRIERRKAGALAGSRKAAKLRHDRTRLELSDLMPVVVNMKNGGARLDEIADYLNANGMLTRTGGKWSKGSLSRLVGYAKECGHSVTNTRAPRRKNQTKEN
jgi:DNA invertase Pin-like site-specific DNA recombinase